MADTEGQPASGEESRANETQVTETPKTPRNDAEAAAAEAAKAGESTSNEGEQGEPKPKRNRTGEFIDKLKTDNRSLRERNEELTRLLKLREKPPEPTPAPTFEQSNFDPAAYADARAKWAAESAVQNYQNTQERTQAQARLQQIERDYNARINEATTAHPDFVERVTALSESLSAMLPEDHQQAIGLAIMSHPQGPEVAYAIANDDDLAFQLASIQPRLAAAAVDRIAARLAAAHEAPQTPTPNAKPVSQAPPPVQTVSGKTPTKTPPEKLTDAEWWKRRSKRAS